jgi:NAD+ synthase
MSADNRLAINTELTRRLLISFIQSEIGKFGFARAVVALSGGVDSALVAFLTTEAMGQDNVLAIMMPYRTSDPQSEADARQVIGRLGIQSRRVEITPLVEPYLALYPDMGQKRRGNVMARARMIILYDQSEEFGGLVIGTSNKTEALLGYFTLFGDAAAAIQPLADLYKTQVRQLARAVGVPSHIVDKAPSADLWAGQTDEGELGFTYADVDQLLCRLIDERAMPEEVIAEGFDPSFVRRVIGIVQRTQYKRLPPPVAKVSNRTIGADFLYPRDWGV